MTKKICSVLMGVILIYLGMLPCFAVSPTISVGTATAMPGDTITIPVSISGNPGINTFSLGFEYDKGKLTVLDVTPSPQLGGQFAYKKKAVWLNSTDSNYNGVILYLKIRVSESAAYGESTISVTYSPGDISNYNENDVNFAVSSGQIIIGLDQQTVDKLILLIRRMFEMIKKMVLLIR